MNQDEFSTFMRSQCQEIKNYQNSMREKASTKSLNELALEWIGRFAKQYRKKWQDKQYVTKYSQRPVERTMNFNLEEISYA